MLGLGWNFLFVGGTSLLTETYAIEEKAKAQALNDFVLFAIVAASSLSAGVLQYHLGWPAVNVAMLAPLALILGAILWLRQRQRLAGLAQIVS
jgi:MFS family permease